ncbi:MAG: formate--phosphoribosylaminoimidazolecarboxamide ligase family protein [Nitrososphaerota archaeon]|nr:formate--phosphoribosylaminoimidazolecarboxamide ligase family protein [Nitrososphaerota archaeon]MDG6940010.1 formate--phosphoribosylaminoimidazolecarboxamide ligase family protein [Nitrososphaerota archaeon]
MIGRPEMRKVVESYDAEKVTICALGSHSALDILDGAKDEGFRTMAVCQKGRERPYRAFGRIVDDVLTLDAFSGVLDEGVQEELRARNVIFVPHRAFTTYLDYDSIEERFRVPVFGNREMLRIEQRTGAKNQYGLLEDAGIRTPKRVAGPEEIAGPVIVKVQEAKRKAERAFFVAGSYEDFKEASERRMRSGLVSAEGLRSAVIEELVVGASFNFNYFYSPLTEEVEFLGVDRRLQTNLSDFVALPAEQQLRLDVQVQNIEIGHTPATIRESMLEKVFDMGERFARAAKKAYPPGLIGPFALQGVVTVGLEIVVFDVSPRVPGSPILATTSPYSKYYFGEVVGTGRRIAMEVRRAVSTGRLGDLVT